MDLDGDNVFDRIADYLEAHGYEPNRSRDLVDIFHRALIVEMLDACVPTPAIVDAVLTAEDHNCGPLCPDLEIQT